MIGSFRVGSWRSPLAVLMLVLSLAMVGVPVAAAAPEGTSRTLDLSVIAQVIVVIVLAAVFVAAVLVTPKIWHSNEPRESADRRDEIDREGRPS